MQIWIAAVMTLTVTAVAAPLVRTLLAKHGVVDVPNLRSSHEAPTPRGGGIACGLGVASGSCVAALAGADVPWAVVAAALALALVGLLDDKIALSATSRLASQVIIGAILGFILGGTVGALAGAFVMPAVVNIVNFMDGINGVTAATSAIWAAAAVYLGAGNGPHSLAILGAVVIGAALGFFPWNAPRARMFLGDVGSYLFGALVAGGILSGATNGVHPGAIVAPMAIYIADTATTLIRRSLRGAPLMQAHREHVYQRLVHEGRFSHMAVTAWVGLTSACVAAAWTLADGTDSAVITICVVLAYLASPLVTIRIRARRPKGTLEASL